MLRKLIFRLLNKKSMEKRKFILPEKELREKILSKFNGKDGEFNISSIQRAIAVFEIADQIQNSLSSHFARYGLTQARFIVLLTMFTGDKSNWNPLELAEIIKVKPPTMTGILDVLVRDEYVIRKSDEKDRRKILVYLTAKGKRKIKEILPDHFNRISSSFKNLGIPKNSPKFENTIKEIRYSLSKLLEGVNAPIR